MANVYGRVAKISNAAGRSEYITDTKRQEEIVLHKEHMEYSWREHSEFEKTHQKTNVENNEALEVHIALPNTLSNNKSMLEQVCDSLAQELVGHNKDYEYSVHWNHNRTNLHVHILFSERENQSELEPKVYKKDIWQDKDSHKLAKANADNAELVHRKGEIQKDKEGNIKYQTDIFKPKDKKFIQSSWVHEKNRIIESVMKSYGFNLEYQDKTSPYIAQKKLYKGASEDYLEQARAWNAEARRYNEGVRQHIDLEPSQLENYHAIKAEVLANVREANAAEKKITPRAILLVSDMADWVQETVMQLKVFVRRKVRELASLRTWEQVKDKFSDLFAKSKYHEAEIAKINHDIGIYNQAEKEVAAVLNSKLGLIRDIESYEKKRQQEQSKPERKRNYDIEL